LALLGGIVRRPRRCPPDHRGSPLLPRVVLEPYLQLRTLCPSPRDPGGGQPDSALPAAAAARPERAQRSLVRSARGRCRSKRRIRDPARRCRSVPPQPLPAVVRTGGPGLRQLPQAIPGLRPNRVLRSALSPAPAAIRRDRARSPPAPPSQSGPAEET